MKKYNHGFIVGKFMPLHNGHVLVIDTALAQCEQVTICLLSRTDEVIPGETRLSWLRSLYGSQCVVTHHTNELPQDEGGYEHWDQYLASIRLVCSDSYDAVFSSEAYGERLAKDLAAEHMSVDAARTAVPVSGTLIRSNPLKHFDYLPDIVKEYYDS